MFRRQFLGETVNAYTCKIMNESDLVFQYDENRLLLTAYSLRPLIISNKSLGYQITFYLDAFEYSQITYSLSYTGYYNFREDSTLNSKERVGAENRRRLGSICARIA